MMTFIEHPGFTHRIEELLTDEEYGEFQMFLTGNPQAGAVIPGMNGLRKVRVALSGRGKRGGARVLYVLFMRAETIYFAYVYTKGEFEDLPPEKRRVMKQITMEIKKEFEP